MQNEKVSCEVIPQESVFENLRFSVLILVDDLDSKVVKLFESFFSQDPEAFLVVVCSCNHKCAEFREIDEVRTEMLSPGEWWQVSENASFGEKLFFGLERVETDFWLVR